MKSLLFKKSKKIALYTSFINTCQLHINTKWKDETFKFIFVKLTTKMHAVYKIPYNKKNGFNLCQQLQEQQLIQDDNLIKVAEYFLKLKKKYLLKLQ